MRALHAVWMLFMKLCCRFEQRKLWLAWLAEGQVPWLMRASFAWGCWWQCRPLDGLPTLHSLLDRRGSLLLAGDVRFASVTKHPLRRLAWWPRQSTFALALCQVYCHWHLFLWQVAFCKLLAWGAGFDSGSF